MQYDFDCRQERKGSHSVKWERYGPEILPLWVADMDFVSPEPIAEALRQRAGHRIFGYTQAPPELCSLIQTRLDQRHQWEIQPEELIFLPGLVTGLNIAIGALSGPGDGILAQPPVYPHLIKDPVIHGRTLLDPPLVQKGDSYEIDFDDFERSITGRTRVFLLCNPHNPVGRVYTRDELERIAAICLRHGLIICSDEIHCDLIYPGYRHIPIATLAPEIADRTVTLMAPSKTYNVAGLGMGFAVIKNPDLRKRWKAFSRGLVPWVNLMGYEAALAGFRDGQEWLDQVLVYLRENRDFLARFVGDRLPGIGMSRVEGTYLAWLDCRRSGIPGSPFQFFLEKAKVALNDGFEFGRGGEGFVRLNFACPKKVLAEALERMAAALKRIGSP